VNKSSAIKYLSFKRIKKVLAENPTAVASTQVLTDAKTDFNTKLTDLEDIYVPEIRETKANTDRKNKELLEVSNLLFAVSNGLALYAASVSDMELAGKLPATISELREGIEVTQLQRYWNILNAAKAITPATLVPFGVTAAELTLIETLLNSLNNLIGSPRSAIDVRVLLNDKQEKTIEEVDKFLLATLDLAVRNRKIAFPDFVAAYFLARKLHDMPSNPNEEELATINATLVEAPSSLTSADLKVALENMDTTQLTTTQPATNGVHEGDVA